MTARRVEIAGGGKTEHRLDPTCILYLDCVDTSGVCVWGGLLRWLSNPVTIRKRGRFGVACNIYSGCDC